MSIFARGGALVYSGQSRGGTDLELERGYGDVRPWRPPFQASPVVSKGPISSKRVSSQDPLSRKFVNFSLYSLNFCPNLSSPAPKFGNFQLTSPQIWKFSVHKPLNLEIFSSQTPSFRRQISVCKPHTLEIQVTHPYLKKKSRVPPPPPVVSTMDLLADTNCRGHSAINLSFFFLSKFFNRYHFLVTFHSNLFWPFHSY